MTNDNSINFWVNSDLKYESSFDISNPWELILNSPINKNKMKASYEILEINVCDKNLPLLETWTPNNRLTPLKQILKGDLSVETGHYYISKVKRIVDNQVFTVGDKIDRIATINGCYKNNAIKGFSISNRDELIVSLGKQIDDTYYGSKGCNLSIISHSKEEKILTTEDGVDMFKGQKCWILDKVHNYDYYSFILDNTHISGKNMFSTKEKVEDYVLHNKPCLSLNDVKNIIVNDKNALIFAIRELTSLKLKK